MHVGEAIAPMAPMVGCAHDENLPFVDVGAGIELKVLRVVETEGIWVVRNRFQPGATIPRHRHTGWVHGFTIEGCWHYAEYGIDYTAGTYIYEPANSVHTLTVNADNEGATDVLFVMQGANLNVDEKGEVWRVDDGPSTLAFYLAMCEELGHGRPPVLTD